MFCARRVASLCLLVALSWGCDLGEEQDTFAEDAARPPSGITRVDAEGKVLSQDEDDWRTAPVYVGEVRVEPAEPNPATAGGFVSIRVTVTLFNAVRSPLRLKVRRNDGLLETIGTIDRAADPGAYAFYVPTDQIGPRGLHRVFVFDGVGEIVSYGDVMVQ